MLQKTRRKLILWNFAIITTLALTLTLIMYGAVSRVIESDLENDLYQSANAILQNTKPVRLSLAEPLAPTKINLAFNFDDDDKENKENENKEDDDKNERLETVKNLQINLSEAFFFIVDRNGVVLENPRQIKSVTLPDQAALAQSLRGERNLRELRIENNIPIKLYSVPIYDENKRILGVLQVGMNTASHNQQAQQILVISGLIALGGLLFALAAAFFLTKQALVPVRESFERQRRFVADASHELRTPLTLIRASTEFTLRNKNKTVGEVTTYLDDIKQETDYLAQLITDLLTLAQIDAGKLELKSAPVDLGKLAQSSLAKLQPLAAAKNLELKGEITAGEIWVQGDEIRLRQLLLILLDNAIKYTNAGQIYLRVKTLQHKAVIEVEDSGIGISAANLDLIFERFYRVDKARSRSEGGFGLGLAIAQWIVQAHDGELKVQSQPGRGSVFTISLPLGAAPTEN